jgi:hypothetical protein
MRKVAKHHRRSVFEDSYRAYLVRSGLFFADLRFKPRAVLPKKPPALMVSFGVFVAMVTSPLRTK